jgi:hypothetical protein
MSHVLLRRGRAAQLLISRCAWPDRSLGAAEALLGIRSGRAYGLDANQQPSDQPEPPRIPRRAAGGVFVPDHPEWRAAAARATGAGGEVLQGMLALIEGSGKPQLVAARQLFERHVGQALAAARGGRVPPAAGLPAEAWRLYFALLCGLHAPPKFMVDRMRVMRSDFGVPPQAAAYVSTLRRCAATGAGALAGALADHMERELGAPSFRALGYALEAALKGRGREAGPVVPLLAALRRLPLEGAQARARADLAARAARALADAGQFVQSMEALEDAGGAAHAATAAVMAAATAAGRRDVAAACLARLAAVVAAQPPRGERNSDAAQTSGKAQPPSSQRASAVVGEAELLPVLAAAADAGDAELAAAAWDLLAAALCREVPPREPCAEAHLSMARMHAAARDPGAMFEAVGRLEGAAGADPGGIPYHGDFAFAVQVLARSVDTVDAAYYLLERRAAQVRPRPAARTEGARRPLRPGQRRRASLHGPQRRVLPCLSPRAGPARDGRHAQFGGGGVLPDRRRGVSRRAGVVSCSSRRPSCSTPCIMPPHARLRAGSARLVH